MKKIRKFTALLIAIIMMASNIGPAFATSLTHDSWRSDIINDKDPVRPAKLKEGENSVDFIKDPDQPDIYTLRTDYKVQRGERYDINYQPYIASVGADATDDEREKVKKEITLPDLAGYDKNQLDDTYTIDYDTVKKAAEDGQTIGNEEIGYEKKAWQDFRYKAKPNQIQIKHIFQSLEDFSKYTNPDGSQGEKGQLVTIQNGNTGSTMEVSPLDGPERKGFVPEQANITMRVPENAENFVLEYRYNRDHFDVTFDTAGGTALPSRTLYYEQIVPIIDENQIPTKIGGVLQGWMPSIDLEGSLDNVKTTFKKDEIIKDANGKAILNLDAKIKMPASKITFTAVWKDKEKADYAIQFWAEKSDHADGASILEKYDYMGTRVYKDADTGTRADLDNEPVKGLKFPDLDQARLQKIWNGDKFNRGRNLYLNKFYVYNQDLTHEQNVDPKDANLVKSVSSTGKTVYNIYYDRQVYDLYFTKSNAQPDKNTLYPEIWGYDQKKGEAVMLGGPGNLYHYKARFNEMMYKWPNDAKQTKGFTPGYQSFGWGPNYAVPYWPLHLDTPPYRLNADEFLDMTDYTNKGGYTKHIDKGDGTTIDLAPFDFTTLSFGIKQDHPSIPHHMDFWMDGFKDGETIIRYDLVRTKADTASLTYGHKYPIVTGFTPYGYKPRTAWPTIEEGSEENGRVNEEGINDLNDERDDITPNTCGTYYNNNGIKLPIGQLDFISVFFSDSDEYGDVKEGGQAFEENGYLRYKYTRNKYPLRFNYDPSIIRDDSYFNSKNQLDTFYEFPLKVLSPDLVDSNLDREDREYFKEDPKNFLDNPENLQKLGLTDLVFTDTDGKLKVKRPDNLSDQMVFKGWALDPAGTKLVWENKDEKMPTHPLNLYAKWDEPDYKWKVTFDPDGGSLKNLKEESITQKRKTIQEGDIGQEEVNTYAKKEDNDGNKQVFTVIQRQKLVEPKAKPVKKGYDFMGWEIIRYKKNEKGDYTDEVDTSYRDTYGVPELYSFGNDVVAPVYLKAIWVPNQRVDINIEHYMLDKNYELDKKISPNPIPDKLEDKRAGYLVATTGDRQDDEYILAPQSELEDNLTGDMKTIYEEYNKRVGLNNSFFQTFRVEPEKRLNTETNELEDNPDVKDNVFKFFYRPYRKREYKVNYIDERFKGKEKEEGAAIIDQELVKNGNRHFDARNYRRIPGWKLVSAPQQQLFFDVDEKTNEFLGINGTGKDEITFYYKDVRVIEVPNKNDPVPDGYVRVTYKADKGGAFTDKEGNSKTELYYDVIKGLKSDLLPVPKELEEGKEKEEGKYYITPETGKKFIKWDEKPLLNKNTIVDNDTKDFYVFTAKFEWSGLTASGLVRTEAFKDPDNKWTNDFAPTIDQLKAQLVWREKDQVKDLPAGAVIKLFDEAGNELTKDDQVYNLVNEKKAADKDELVRTVNIKAKVTFTDGKDPQELDIPITVYKNVYEALTTGEKPLFLSDAEKGELKDITGNYVRVTVNPTGKPGEKDSKIYYVNPKAWVEIPEIKLTDTEKENLGFTNWTADKDAQNENKVANGVYEFTKRHMFTENTIISPGFAKDVVEQTDPNKKPDVPKTYVKVIVKTTDNATDETKFEKTFWVNPTKEVPIDVTNPTGKTVAADPTKIGTVGYTMNFSKWKSEETTPRTWEDKIVGKFEKETTIVAKYSVKPEVVKPQVPSADTVHTPQGKTPTVEEITKMIIPPEGKTIRKVTIVENPDVNKPGKSIAKVIVEYTDGSSVGTNDKPLEVPVQVHEPIVPAKPDGTKPEGAMDNYVKVIFKAGEGGSLSGDTVYYVSPEVEVDMTKSAAAITKTPDIGYFVDGEKWDNIEGKNLKDIFKDPETEFVFNFSKSADIVEKIDENTKIPNGYVKVTFKTEDKNKGKLEGDKAEKIYYVNPKAGIKLKVLEKGQTAGKKELKVPETLPAKNYVFDKWQEGIDEKTPITSERVHVAIFKYGQVTLTYKKGGDDVSGDLPAKTTANYGATVGLAGPGNLAKPNSTFKGWKLDGEDDKIYQPGDQVTLEKARTATAQWEEKPHTVKFVSRGIEIGQQEVKHNEQLKNVNEPKIEGKVFMGWKENDSDKEYFDLTTPITADKTLVAIWQDPVQKIDENATVEDKFIKVTFKEGDHGKLNDSKNPEFDKVTYKVAKTLSFEKAEKNGMEVPGIKPAKYYKAKDENSGWDKTLDLILGANETEKVFTAKYEPIADVIPVDPAVTDEEEIKKEKPEGMVLVTFSVDESKAFMDGNSRFYVKANTRVDITPPVVHPRTLENDQPNDYEFNGWNYEKDEENKYNFIFKEDTNIDDGSLVKPIITIRHPKSNATVVYVSEITEGATAYIEVIRGSNPPVLIEAVTNDDGDVVFKIPGKLGGKLRRRDKIRAYSKLNNVQSDIREYRVR
uniref:InlB B-repeat-containing protein n=1 Tax=Anaerococcus mediterraneensis TaxID=1870984 RepID=UPI00093165E4|nr:InlB B-repeat-containing protein [Anaerococcus mediterraneensis]